MDAIFRFLRPTLLVVGCYWLAILASYLLSQPETSAILTDTRRVEEFSSTISSLVLPHPSLAADDVVRIQLAGLSNEEQAQGILQCMTFASPDNRSVTGPLERFGRMVRSGRYGVLTDPDRVLIGKPTFVNGNARVLVTLVDEKELRSFVWVLSKQEEPPYEDCWMTDGVFPLKNADSQENSPGSIRDVI